MWKKEYYFFFDSDGMPMAVFLTYYKSIAIELMCRLYRQTWPELKQMGIKCEREADVPSDRWDAIHKEYCARAKAVEKPITVVAATELLKRNLPRKEQYLNTGLQTEKYYSRM